MSKQTVSPALLCGNELRCEHCLDLPATHFELSPEGTHDSNEHEVLCGECAYLAGLKITGVPAVSVRVRAYAFDLIPLIAPSYDADHSGGPRGPAGPGGVPRRLYLQPGEIRLVARPDRRAG